MAAVGQEPSCLRDGHPALLVHVREAPRSPGHEIDPEPARVTAYLISKGLGWRGRSVGLTRFRAGHAVEQGRRVADAPGVLVNDAPHEVPEVRGQRHPAPGRLQPHEPAAGRRDPDRAAPSLPWATGTSRAATAAADPPLEPPGDRVVSQGFRVGP